MPPYKEYFSVSFNFRETTFTKKLGYVDLVLLLVVGFYQHF